MGRLTIAVVGSGFAGSILARALNRQGHRVLLCERDRHPRFALGESSTPLAALSLERLATRYDLPDLAHLAAYGRWLRHLPQLRRGLKRGFTFYFHRRGESFRNGPSNGSRLLVAASPSDAVADSHWLREDVDAFLVERAVEEGVEYLDCLELEACEHVDGGLRLTGKRIGRSLRLDVDFVADASGAGGFLAGQFGISRRKSASLQTDLVFGHFEGVRSFTEVAGATGATFTAGPYSDERAAVHHLLEEGWMYALPFDHGVVSAGVLLDRSADAAWLGQLDALAPERAWEAVLARYPTLRHQFGDARPVRPIGRIRRLQRHLSRAAGENWALLPHTYAFLSPLFSTGIAWSLVAVERLAGTLADAGPERKVWVPDLGKYAAVLEAEADHLERLVPAAYRLRRQFDLFADYSFLYFAAVSYAESAQRLLDRPEGGGAWAWEPFLGAGDPVVREALDRTLPRVEDLAARTASAAERGAFTAAIRDAIAPRNVAGLADPRRENLYPVDLACLIDRAGLLGLAAEDVRRDLERLRGGSGSSG